MDKEQSTTRDRFRTAFAHVADLGVLAIKQDLQAAQGLFHDGRLIDGAKHLFSARQTIDRIGETVAKLCTVEELEGVLDEVRTAMARHEQRTQSDPSERVSTSPLVIDVDLSGMSDSGAGFDVSTLIQGIAEAVGARLGAERVKVVDLGEVDDEDEFSAKVIQWVNEHGGGQEPTSDDLTGDLEGATVGKTGAGTGTANEPGADDVKPTRTNREF